MLLRIAPSRLISEVQNEFANAFPFLKLEFFQNKTPGSANTAITRVVQPSGRIGEYQNNSLEGALDIYPEMKVSDLEKLIKDKFNLNVQVFRRSGTLWLQTTMTDNWTLQKQNEHGWELSRSHEVPLIKNEDIESG